MYFFIAAAIIIIICFVIFFIKLKRKKYVLENSEALKKIKEINNNYQFREIYNLKIQHVLDNEDMYADINCTDYLIYELVNIQSEVDSMINNVMYNIKTFDEYNDELNLYCHLGRFKDYLKRNNKRILSLENKLFNELKLSPNIDFKMFVEIILTDLSGNPIKKLENSYEISQIYELEKRVNNKNNCFFNDSAIWDSIVKIERSKVTNKLRFQIFERDGYRCVCCKKETDDLEIDHIVPISKGGKSVYSNLQTLCHECNVKKGNR